MDPLLQFNDIGHQGDFDYTQITQRFSISPTQRLHHLERWRGLLRRGHQSMMGFVEEMVQRLSSAGVEYVVVGGVSAVLQGVPIVTADFDVCYARTPENIRRLVEGLQGLNPRLRGLPPDVPSIFDERTVRNGCNFTLVVGAEDENLDLLGEMSAIGGYDQIIGSSASMDVAGCPVKVLSLSNLIATKQAAGRPKDLAVIPLLHAVLQMQEEQSSSDPP